MRRRLTSLRSAVFAVVLAALLVAATAATTLALVTSRPTTVVATPEDVTRVSIIGDSYSSGLNNTVVWPSLLANRTQLAMTNVAFPGAGFVGGTGQSGPFADQVEKALAGKPDVIVVFGGINDVGKSDDLVTQAATDLFTGLARRAPGATVLAFGPIWHVPDLPPSFYAVDAAIAEGARRSNVGYTSLIRENWLVGDGLIQPDQVHPTDAGQLVLESRLGPLLLDQIADRDTGDRT